MGRVLSGGLVVVLSLAAGATAAQAAPTVGSLGFSPAGLTAGQTLTAGGKVANRGNRAALVTVRLSLRADGTTRTIGSVRVRAKAHNKTRYRVSATIPDGTATGRYDVVACVARACRTAGPKVLVLAPPPRTTPPVTADAPSTDLPPAPPATSPPAAPILFPPGARSGGDILFPQIGNGGYDARHYDLKLSYDQASASLTGEATMDAVATQNLGQFSMDFQGMTVQRVRINGQNVTFSRELPAQAARNAETIASKLVITPVSGIVDGSPFSVTVDYSGVPDTVVDPDDAEEGWFPTAGGGAVVCQPIGCQAIFPQNNVPYDKATFDMAITVPDGMSGIGNGELVGTTSGGGRTTWRWHMGEPISTYLTTATIGNYDVTQATDPQGRQINNFVDQAFTPVDLLTLNPILAQQTATVDYIAGLLGPYPFGSYGAIAADAPNLGYALEVATKPFYPSATEPATTHTHELLHQWFGDSVTYRQIRDLWIHEGMASWFETRWNHDVNANPQTTATQFEGIYNGAGPSFWAIAPATPTAEQLFSSSVYYRGFLTYEGLRQIVGETDFFDILSTIAARYRHGSISTADVIAVAEEVSGRDLDQFFQDYLYTPAKPPRPSTYT